MASLLKLTNGVPRLPHLRMAVPASFELDADEAIAICGDNGSGKSLLVKMLTGSHPLQSGRLTYDFGEQASPYLSDHLRALSFHDAFEGLLPAYHQQRWNHWDDETPYPTVAEVLGTVLRTTPSATQDLVAALLNDLQLQSLAETPIHWLSSGELRKFQIAKALLSQPRILLLDNPFIGLDTASRQCLEEGLQRLARRMAIVLVVTQPKEIPAFITHVVPVVEKRVLPKMSRTAFLAQPPLAVSSLSADDAALLRDLAARTPAPENETLIHFKNVSVTYFGKPILRDITWLVRRGEHWALTGENGAGKSTLLSLVCADNPMAYACDITLFGYRRGSGESIWDIKRHIGYCSPELQRTFRKALPVIDVVAGGLHDTNGYHRSPTDEERTLCRNWLSLFRLAHLAERNYLTLSNGEQLSVLLARAFVKSPSLLILDEPFHGLDAERLQRAKNIIDTYSRCSGKTLIMVSHYDQDFPSCITQTLHLTKPKQSSRL